MTSKTQKRVLIVEDDLESSFLLSEVLESLNLLCSCVRNGKQALEIIEKEDFNLIFMDIEMPVMNGFETTVVIREQLFAKHEQFPIIAISAHTELFIKKKYKDLFNDVLQKPYNIVAVKRMIELYT